MSRNPLAHLPTHVCPESGDRYTVWSEIQESIAGVDHLEIQLRGGQERVLFMNDKHGELYVSCRFMEIANVHL